MKYCKNIKLALAALSAAAIAPAALSAPVSPERAAEIAAAELKGGISPTGMKARSSAAYAAPQMELAYTSTTSKGDCLYVFTMKSQPGFVIAPADDRLPGVLAYSETGSFDATTIPENVKWWLGEYSKEVDLLLSGEMANMRKTARAPRKAVAPLLTTKWNQSAPFNDDCPTDDGGRCVTGCVATAMAQVMKHHNWPPQGKGERGGYSFDGHRYDWSNMIDVYSGGKYSSTEASAVALLMVDCGKSVDMNYTSSASGTQSNRVGVALTDYFDYDPSLRLEVRMGHPLAEWEQMVYDEVAAGRPVYYSGANSSSGHAFVCDGYQGDGFFHFNWGWGGAYDGYFRLFALDPAGGGIGSSSGGYNEVQQIFTHVMPNTGKPCPRQVLLVPDGGYKGEMEGEEVNVTFFDYETGESSGAFNYLGYTENVDVALQWTDKSDRTKVLYGQAYAAEFQSYYGMSGICEAQPSDAGDGRYEVAIAYRSQEEPDRWYTIRGIEGQPQYVEVTVSGGKIVSAEAQKIDNKPVVVLLDVETASAEVKDGSIQPLRITLANAGTGNFHIGKSLDGTGNLADNYLHVNIAPSDNPENPVVTTVYKEETDIPANYTSTFMTAPVRMPAEGDYIVSIASETGVVGSAPLKVRGTAEPYEPELKMCHFRGMLPAFADAADEEALTVSFIGQTGQLTSRVTDGAYVRLSLYEEGSTEPVLEGNYPAYYFTNIVGNASYMPISQLEPGHYYWQVHFINSQGTAMTMSPKAPLLVYRSASSADGSLTYNIVPTEAGEGARLTSAPEADETGAVAVPEGIDGYRVVGLTPSLFTFASDMSSVSLPTGIPVNSGQFYRASSLREVALKGAAPAYCSPTAFGPDRPAEITLSVPDGSANRYKRSEGWNLFTFGSWRITLAGGLAVPEGLAADAATGTLYEPYYVGAGEIVRFRLDPSAAADLKVVAKVNGAPEATLSPDADGFYTLPDLEGGSGRLCIAGADGVDGIITDGEPVDVYTLTGICIGRGMSASDIEQLPAGVYIAGGRKIRIR